MEQPINDREERIAVKLVLDTDAAALLPQLAGSPRKQGEYVSKLIREAAARRNATPQPDPGETLRREILGIALQLSTVTQQLIEVAATEDQAQRAGANA